VRPEVEGTYRDGAGYILQGVNVYSGIALLREAEAVDTRFIGRKGEARADTLGIPDIAKSIAH
jgi:hypothetical protein